MWRVSLSCALTCHAPVAEPHVRCSDACACARQTKLRDVTGVSLLKVRRTLEHGFSVEVPPKFQAQFITKFPDAVHVKSVKAGVRYKTP